MGHRNCTNTNLLGTISNSMCGTVYPNLIPGHAKKGHKMTFDFCTKFTWQQLRGEAHFSRGDINGAFSPSGCGSGTNFEQNFLVDVGVAGGFKKKMILFLGQKTPRICSKDSNCWLKSKVIFHCLETVWLHVCRFDINCKHVCEQHGIWTVLTWCQFQSPRLNLCF